MGEPERRRRRLRPSSAAAALPPEEPPAEEPHAEAHEGRAPDRPVPADPRPPGAVGRPVSVETSSIGGASAEDPGADGVAERGVRPARAAYSRRPTSGAGTGSGDDREVERGLRGLVGSGSSQVSVGAALRARDAARPTDEQLAEAEANLAIVRRNWMPREELPRNR